MLKEVKIELTNRCMRNCLHCSSRATNDKKYLEELSFDDVARIILEAKWASKVLFLPVVNL